MFNAGRWLRASSGAVTYGQKWTTTTTPTFGAKVSVAENARFDKSAPRHGGNQDGAIESARSLIRFHSNPEQYDVFVRADSTVSRTRRPATPHPAALFPQWKPLLMETTRGNIQRNNARCSSGSDSGSIDSKMTSASCRRHRRHRRPSYPS